MGKNCKFLIISKSHEKYQEFSPLAFAAIMQMDTVSMFHVQKQKNKNG